jgi:hypothetical protein
MVTIIAVPGIVSRSQSAQGIRDEAGGLRDHAADLLFGCDGLRRLLFHSLDPS